MFLETSARTGENVEEVFLKCARTILSKIEGGRCRPPPVIAAKRSLEWCGQGNWTLSAWGQAFNTATRRCANSSPKWTIKAAVPVNNRVALRVCYRRLMSVSR